MSVSPPNIFNTHFNPLHNRLEIYAYISLDNAVLLHCAMWLKHHIKNH